MSEADIRECHGVTSRAQDKCILAYERNQGVLVAVDGFELVLSPDAADRLASMLRRCARRVRERTSPQLSQREG